MRKSVFLLLMTVLSLTSIPVQATVTDPVKPAVENTKNEMPERVKTLLAMLD